MHGLGSKVVFNIREKKAWDVWGVAFARRALKTRVRTDQGGGLRRVWGKEGKNEREGTEKDTKGFERGLEE